MPLSRYEIRSEYSLANPDLYRAADKDDPEGLLEGVAMAGLVGIIRQLGDLAEFAAEVFHDLHEDVLTIAARGHELLVRVRQLETEVPLIEKMILTKIDYGNSIYNSGLEWHVHIYDDQNHFTQGDLPRFIRSAYEDCRSPPRLFPLDRFDVAGAGSCLKRFTDPSFFKMEWASSELMKAEKEQRDQKARRMKRKGQRQAYREEREAKLAQLRVSTEVEKTETLRTPSSASDLSLTSEQEAGDYLMQENDDMFLASGLLVPEQQRLQSKILAAQDFRIMGYSSDLKMEQSNLDTARHMNVGVSKNLKNDVGKEEILEDDSASETDNFMDAVTTMDSEVETDSEIKAGVEVDGELLVELEEVKAPGPQKQPAFELWSEADEEHDVIIKDKDCSAIIKEYEEGLAIEGDVANLNCAPEESSNTDHAHFVANAPKVFVEEEDCSFVDGGVVLTSVQYNETSIPNPGNGTSLPGLEEDIVAKSEGHLIDNIPTVFAEEEDISVVVKTADVLAVKDNVLTSISHSNASSPVHEEDAVLKTQLSRSNASSPVREEDAVLKTELSRSNASSPVCEEVAVLKTKLFRSNGSSPVHEEDAAPKTELFRSNASSPVHEEDAVLKTELSGSHASSSICEEDAVLKTQLPGSNASSPSLVKDAISSSDRHFQSGSSGLSHGREEDTVLSSEKPLETLEADDADSFLNNVNQISESNAPGKDQPQSNSTKDLGEVTTRKRWQISKLFTKEVLASDLERDSLQVSGSEQSESPRRLSLQSSPSSSIQPMKWAVDLSRSYHSEDELEDMQLSSASPSSGSSTLSSPRPSALATTLLNMSLEHKPQKSVNSSPKSVMSSSSKSGMKTAAHLSALPVNTTAGPLMSSDLRSSADTSPRSSSSSAQPFFDPLPSLALNVNTSSTKNLAETFSSQSPAASNLEVFPPPPPLPPLAWRMTRRTFTTVGNSSKPMEASTPVSIPCDVQVSVNDLSQAFTSATTLPTVLHTPSVKPSELTHAFSPATTGKPTFQKSEVMLDESSTYETGLSDLETLHGRSADLPEVSKPAIRHGRGPSLDFETLHGRSADLPHVSKPAKSHDRGYPVFTSNSGTVEQCTISVVATSDFKEEKVVTEGPDSSLQEKSIDDNILQTGSTPARFVESSLELQTKAVVDYGSSALSRSNVPYVLASNLERKDSTEASLSHDMNRLKKRSKWAWTSSTASSDDREVLLDQIRTRSFSLRNTSREKLVAPRPVTNINVAAILEKANAIRQAFAGSDDDDDEEWSDA